MIGDHSARIQSLPADQQCAVADRVVDAKERLKGEKAIVNMTNDVIQALRELNQGRLSASILKDPVLDHKARNIDRSYVQRREDVGMRSLEETEMDRASADLEDSVYTDGEEEEEGARAQWLVDDPRGAVGCRR